MDPYRRVLDGTQPVAASYDGAIAARLARIDSDRRMKTWRYVLIADLGVVIVFAIFMFVFIGSAVSGIYGSGVVIGAIAGILTFLGGARIAFGIAHRLRDLPPTREPDTQEANLADSLRSSGTPSPKAEREPLLTDVIFIIGGLCIIAVGYTQQFNDIPLSGDVRGTPEYHSAFLAISVILGLFCIVVGSIRLAQGLRRRGR